ncbi:MAG TPA: Gfo/Idh/MocA family oxidoreductase, partial [Bryobacteraceae bacterium]|nr:Gfo/Idh/MocA family oxidoreductase [Bryobacteraceae bacterium]
MHSSDSFSRRTFLAATSGLALARGASSKDRLKAGLVGCGGRGTQAVVNLLTGNENVDLVAMADVFEDHLEGSLERLRNNARYVSRDAGITVERNGKPVQMSAEDLVKSIQPRIKVDPEHHFVGFDSFQKLINSDVDIVMLATPPGYRPQHFEAAINAGKHVFTEKPIAT